MDNWDKIYKVEEVVVKKYESQGSLSEDDVVDCCIMNKLSLTEMDAVCNRLLKRNIIFGEMIDNPSKPTVHESGTNMSPDEPNQIIQTFCEFPKKKVTLKFALVKFGGYESYYDIRKWYDNGEKPGKGLALTDEEFAKLRNSVQKLDLAAMEFKVHGSYMSDRVSATIYNRICICSEFSRKGVPWKKEVSIVDWGYGKKIDFRKWAADYSICGKGVAVSFAEAEEIFEIIKTL